MNYKLIKDFNKNLFFSINSKDGLKILKKYIKNIKGGSSPSLWGWDNKEKEDKEPIKEKESKEPDVDWNIFVEEIELRLKKLTPITEIDRQKKK